MAADVRARTDKQGTIAFTLPISCQICLGKVKKPVLCPNNHVFCAPCMDVWLQKNQQCPACRTPINPVHPVKQIMGGINHIENDKDKMSNPELRKARFDLLYREYEDEFERMTSELTLIKAENDMLRSQLAKDGNKKVLGPREKDSSTAMLALTKKLQDAQKLYEKVKSELTKVKEQNNALKDENINLNHENQKLRTEIASRSPHRYGRVTVSTLETKVQSMEKETARLNKALEKSDKYIEELEKDLEMYRGKDRYQSSAQKEYKSSQERSSELDNPSKRQLFTEPLTNGESYRHALDDDYLKTYNKPTTTKSNLKTRNCNMDGNDYLGSYQSKSYGNGKTNGKSGKRVTFDLNKNDTTSFDLEMPSPMKQTSGIASPVKGVLKSTKKSGNDSFDLSKPSSIEDARSYKSYSKDDSDLYLSKVKSHSDPYDDETWKSSGKSKVDNYMNDSFSLEDPRNVKSYKNGRDFDDTQQIQKELDDLDISLTPDFTDCMKLLNRAEKKVHNLGDDSLMDLPSSSNYHNGDSFSEDYKPRDLDNYRSKDRYDDNIQSARSYLPESTYTSKYYSSDVPSSTGDLYPVSSLPPSYSASYKPGSLDYNSNNNENDRKYSDIGSYKSSVTDIPSYKPSTSNITSYKSSLDSLDYKPKDDVTSTTYSTSSSLNKKYPSSLRFGRSPSLDNLFMSKPSTSTIPSGSRTAEDLPLDYKGRSSIPDLPGDYKVRSSLPDYSSTRYGDDGLGKNYLTSLPPRPQSARGRSYSDMGTTVSSLARGKAGVPDIDPPNGVLPSTSNPSALYSNDKPPLYTTSSHPIGNGPIKAHQSYAYTDVDLGVNPRHRASTEGLRTRSSSLDIPLNEITKYTSTQSDYPVSFAGSSEMSRYSAPYIPSSSVPSSVSLRPVVDTGYSYVSNSSSLGNGTDSFLPEPKKRLFDSSDDLEMSLSPIKSTRKM